MISFTTAIIIFLVLAAIFFAIIKLIQKTSKKMEQTKYKKDKDPLKQLKTYPTH